MAKRSRRDFVRNVLLGGAAAAGSRICSGLSGIAGSGKIFIPASAASVAGTSVSCSAPREHSMYSISKKDGKGLSPGIEAMYYEKLGDQRVRCELCHRGCVIADGNRGFCRNRENRGGTLFSMVFGRPSAVEVDPVEKEPQHHMLPGTEMLSIGTAGCNFRCRHCHNWHLSQRSIEEIGRYYDHPPQVAVQRALDLGVRSISSTYNEPTVFYEYVLETAKLARGKGLRIIWHSNGYMKPDPLKELLQHTDSVTIDLKGFSQSAYGNSSAELKPVLETLEIIRKSGVWLEIVNLVIPTVNDSMREIGELSRWIRDTLSPEVPLHFSRFFPSYRLTHIPATPVETLDRAWQTARKTGIHYVTIGNVPGHRNNSTFCPKCGGMLLHRVHFQLIENNIADGKCAACGHAIPGIWV